MTRLLLHQSPEDKHINTKSSMARSTATSSYSASTAMELPRYRGRKDDSKQDSFSTESDDDDEGRRRYDSMDSDFTNNFANDIPDSQLQYSATLTSTTSLLEKPVVRRLVFRRHWLWSDMTVYSSTPSSISPSTIANGAPEVSSTTTQKSTSSQSSTTAPPPVIETPIYHLATSELNCYRPDITLYAGSTPNAAHVLAVSHFRWTRNARMGFGADALDDKEEGGTGQVVWEELRNTSNWCMHGTYEFEVPVEFTSSSRETGKATERGEEGWAGNEEARESVWKSSSVKRRHFKLQRTHSPTDGVEGWAGWLSYRNYLLLDMDAHETVGVFLADNLRSLTKKGELRLFRALGWEVEVGVVLALGTVSEKATRRERHSRHGGHG